MPKDSSVASSTNNIANSRYYVQNITLNSDGLVTGITSAQETVTNTDTTYDVLSSGGLTLSSSNEFSITNSITSKRLNDAAKTVDLTFDAHGLISAATLQDIQIAQSQVTNLGTALTGKQDTLTFGTSNTNAVKVDSTSIISGEYARFTSSGLESLSATELKSALNLPTNTGTSISAIQTAIGTATLSTSATDLKSAINELETNNNSTQSAVDTLESGVGTVGSLSTSATNLVAAVNENVTNIDTVKTSVGLEANGSYSAITGANYADSATSLKAAVAQLDTQVKTNANNIATLEKTVGGLFEQQDHGSGVKSVIMPPTRKISSHTGPFEIDMADVIANNGGGDIIFYGSTTATHADSHFEVDTTNGDAIFTGYHN